MAKFVGMMRAKQADSKASATKAENPPAAPVNEAANVTTPSTDAPQVPVTPDGNDAPEKVEVKPEPPAQETKQADSKASATKASK